MKSAVRLGRSSTEQLRAQHLLFPPHLFPKRSKAGVAKVVVKRRPDQITPHLTPKLIPEARDNDDENVHKSHSTRHRVSSDASDTEQP